MKYELGEEVDDPFASQSPSSSKLNYTLGEEADDPFGEKPKKGDRSVKAAAGRGLEETALNAGALVSEVGKHVGGGKVFPKWMKTAAEYLHNPNYVPGAEDITAKDASLGDRAAGVGRALIEGAPTLAIGALGGAPGMAAAAGTIGAGSGIRRVRAADNIPEDQALDGGQLGRVGASATIDALGTLIPAGKALEPIKGAAVTTLPRALAKAGITGLRDTAQAAKSGAVSNMAQTAAQAPILEGRMATPEELAAAGAVGGAAAGGARGARIPTQLGEEVRFSQFNGQDPKALAAAAKRLNDVTGGYGKIKEGNSEDIRRTALGAARAHLDFEGRGQQTKGSNLIEDHVNQLSAEGNAAPARAFSEAMDALGRGEPVQRAHIEELTNAIGNHPQGAAWLSKLQEASALGELGNIGTKVGTDGRSGGFHATSPGKSIDWLAQKFGLGSLGIGLAGHAMGMSHPIGQVGTALGAGATGMSAASHGLDAIAGYNNPVGRFARRYSPAAEAIKQTVSQGSSSPPPSGPPAPPTGPLVNPLGGRIAAVLNRQPRNPFPQMQGPPARMPQDNFRGGLPGAPGAAQAVPGSLPDPLTLVRARQALGQDNALAQDNVHQFPDFGGQDNRPMMMQDNGAPTMPLPGRGPILEQSEGAFPQPANDVPSPATLALAKRMAPPMPGEDMAGMELAARGRDNEVPLDYEAQSPSAQKLGALMGRNPELDADMGTIHGQYGDASPVDTAKLKELARINAAVQKMQGQATKVPPVKPMEKPAPAPKPKKEVKLEASVTPMEEAVSGRSAKASPMDEAMKPNIQYYDYKGYKVPYDANKVENPTSHEAGTLENLKVRHKFINNLKKELPELSDDLEKFFSEKWIERDDGSALGRENAADRLRDFLREKGLPDDELQKHVDLLFDRRGRGVAKRYWGK